MCGKGVVRETWLVLRVVGMWYGEIFWGFVGGRVQSVPLGRLGGESFSASKVFCGCSWSCSRAVGRICWLQDWVLVAGL